MGEGKLGGKEELKQKVLSNHRQIFLLKAKCPLPKNQSDKGLSMTKLKILQITTTFKKISQAVFLVALLLTITE